MSTSTNLLVCAAKLTAAYTALAVCTFYLALITLVLVDQVVTYVVN